MLVRLLPVWVLLMVILVVGWQWLASNPDWSYIYDGDRGILRPEVEDYWVSRVPRVVGYGSVLALLLIGSIRAWRSREWSLLASGMGVSVLAIGLLILVTIPSQRASTASEKHARATPKSPSEVFSWEQWWALQLVTLHDVQELGDLLESGIGLAEHPGFIPYDRFLLDRVTFIGLNQAEVERLIGPPNRIGYFRDYKSLSYVMIGEPTTWLNGGLTFRIRRTVDGDFLVDEELIRGTRRPQY